MNSAAAELPDSIRRLRLLILGCYYGLIVFFLLQALWTLEAPLFVAIILWIFQIVPLLIFGRGLYRTRLRSYAWCSFAILLYFTHGVLVAFTPGRMLWGIVEIILCVSLFAGLVMFVRGYRRHFNVGL